MQNRFCESFNGRMRDKLLIESLFFGLDCQIARKRGSDALLVIAGVAQVPKYADFAADSRISIQLRRLEESKLEDRVE